MADNTNPRKPLIVKLSLRRSEKRAPPPPSDPDAAADDDDAHSEKRSKVGTEQVSVHAMPTSQNHHSTASACPGTTPSAVLGKSETETQCGSIVKEHPRDDAESSRKSETQRSVVQGSPRNGARSSRTGSEECRLKEGVLEDKEEKKKKKPMVTIMEMDPCKKMQCSIVQENFEVDARSSRTGSEECRLKESVLEGEKEKKGPGVQIMEMDRCKKMQCWVILKRLMIDRDGRVFKQPLDPRPFFKVPYHNSEPVLIKPMGLEIVESKLNKWLYLEPDEFAEDIRLIFSNALLFPPRNEIYRIARRLRENFELSWKSLKDKWSIEDGKGKKIKYSMREVSPKVHNRAGEVHEKKTPRGNNGDLRDSDRYCDAKKSLSRPKRSGSKTDSCPSFQGQVRSSASTSQRELNMSISDSQLSPKKASSIAVPKCQRKHKEKEAHNRSGHFGRSSSKHS